MTGKTLTIVIAISFLVLPGRSHAQRTDTGNWFICFMNLKMNDQWNWWHEAQYRNYNFAGDLQQLLLRTGIGYNLTENNNNVLLGYAFIHSQSYLPDSDLKAASDEHRIYQQLITRQNVGRVFLQHRYRMEERSLSGDVYIRFRYLLSLTIPFNNKTMMERTVYLSAYNEVFLNGQSPVFDRNRLYGGLGYVISKSFRVEAGFMAQTLEKTNRNQFQIILFTNLSFDKKTD